MALLGHLFIVYCIFLVVFRMSVGYSDLDPNPNDIDPLLLKVLSSEMDQAESRLIR